MDRARLNRSLSNCWSSNAVRSFFDNVLFWINALFCPKKEVHHQKRELLSERCSQIFCLFSWLSIFLKRFLFLDSAHPIWASSMRSMPYKITKSLFELPKPCLVQKLVVEWVKAKGPSQGQGKRSFDKSFIIYVKLQNLSWLPYLTNKRLKN